MQLYIYIVYVHIFANKFAIERNKKKPIEGDSDKICSNWHYSIS